MKQLLQKIISYFPNLKSIKDTGSSFKTATFTRTIHSISYKGTIFFALVLFLQNKGMSMRNIALLNSIYFLPQLFSTTLVGSISDALGNRKFFLYSAFLGSGIIFFLLPFPDWVGFFFILRFLQGIIESAIRPLSQAIISEESNEDDRGEKISIYKIFVFFGSMLGPVLMGFLIQYTSFLLAFFITGFLMVFAAGLAYKYIDSEKLGDKSKNKVNFSNIIPVIKDLEFKDLFTEGFIFASSQKEGPRLFSPLKWKNDPASLFCLITFIRRTAFNSFKTFLPIYYTTVIGISEGSAGSFEGLKRFFIILAIIIGGSLADSWGRKPLLIISSFSFLGPLIYVFYPTKIGIWLAAIIIGITIGSFNPTSITYMVDFSPKTKQGTYLGALESSSSLSRILGPALGGFLVEFLSLKAVFFTAGIIMFLTVPLSFLLEESKENINFKEKRKAAK